MVPDRICIAQALIAQALIVQVVFEESGIEDGQVGRRQGFAGRRRLKGATRRRGDPQADPFPP
jgi:hypothetical protein